MFDYPKWQKIIRRLALFFLCSGVGLLAYAQPGNASLRIWVDTDGAADDLRALCMLLAMPGIDIVAVTSSEGALMPADGARKAVALFREFGRGDIPVGMGKELNIPPPRWREQSERIQWGMETNNSPVDSFPSAVNLIASLLERETDPILLVALGTLTNPADLLRDHPELAQKIERIIWYNGNLVDTGVNHDADPESVQKIIESGIPLEIITGEPIPIPIDDRYIGLLESLDHPSARKIVETHGQEVLRPVVASAHMKAWDDLVALFLIAPGLYAPIDTSAAYSIYSLNDEAAAEQAIEVILQLFQ